MKLFSWILHIHAALDELIEQIWTPIHSYSRDTILCYRYYINKALVEKLARK